MKQMLRSLLLPIMMPVFNPPTYSQAPANTTSHHEANFEQEQKSADELFTQKRLAEALPLYKDLCRQDPTIALFAERYGAALLAEEPTILDTNDRLKIHVDGINQLKRAKNLGDNSEYVRITLALDEKTLTGAILSGFPLTIGYTYHGNSIAQTSFRDAEAAFGKADFSSAAELYTLAAAADPTWYDAALYAGDCYFRLADYQKAAMWFAKATSIDPDRETAYRYWGDALFHAGDRQGAGAKFVDAIVAEPYSKLAFAEIANWAQHTNRQLVKPAITRPEFTTPDGVLKIDPELAASTADGRSSWIVYQQYRVAHGARTLNQAVLAGGFDASGKAIPDSKNYRHTIAEEHAALRAMLFDIDARITAGTLTESSLDVSIRDIRNLEKSGVLGAWIAINAADAGIRSDYPDYRTHHREHLETYIKTYLIRETSPTLRSAKPSNGL